MLLNKYLNYELVSHFVQLLDFKEHYLHIVSHVEQLPDFITKGGGQVATHVPFRYAESELHDVQFPRDILHVSQIV